MGNVCPDRQLISVYHDGELPSPWKEKLESHISGCPSCNERLEAYRQITEVPACDMDTARERVWQRLESNSAPPSAGRSFWLQNRITLPVPAVAAAALLLVFFAFIWVKTPGGTAETSDMLLASEDEFEIPGIIPASDMESVLQYLAGRDNGEMLIIRLPESRNFQQYGEPAIVRAADYSRNVQGQGWRKP
jgi:hypothetical protein